MTREYIIRCAIEYLEQHLTEGRGAMSQEPYRGDWFRLFKEAYRGGFLIAGVADSLRPDAFAEIIVTRWFTDDDRDDARAKLMHSFLQRWEEWRYAWDRYEAGT
jgi:hypothetical protein